MRGLAFFDMDGTLIPGSTAMLEIAAVLNDRDFVEEMERRFLTGKVNPQVMMTTCFHRWGSVSEAVFRDAFSRAPKLENIIGALRSIRQSEYVPILITMSPVQFAGYFRDYGFDSIWGSQ